MEKEAKDALPAINRCLQDRSAQIQIAAAGAAYRISGNAKPSVAVLSQFIKDPNPDIRTYACRELREFQGDASPAVPQLIEALKDPDMREDSISVLGSIGPGAKTAIPALRKLVEMGLGADEVADAIRQIEGK